MTILECKNIKKLYKTKNVTTEALKGVNFSVEKGEFISIMGESGAGKTTLLNIIATLDKATSGTLMLNGNDIEEKNWVLYFRTLIFWISLTTEKIFTCLWYYLMKSRI